MKVDMAYSFSLLNYPVIHGLMLMPHFFFPLSDCLELKKARLRMELK
jgi:hypothetical protein